MSLQPLLLLFALVTGLGLLLLALKPMDPPITVDFPRGFELEVLDNSSLVGDGDVEPGLVKGDRVKSCATVEEMGKDFRRDVREESLRMRRIIDNHFLLNGASRIRDLPPKEFCSHGFVLGKTSETGFGNEMYKVLTAAALSVMLNWSLIIGQTRHIAAEDDDDLIYSDQNQPVLHNSRWKMRGV